jgi:hypothetical protein
MPLENSSRDTAQFPYRKWSDSYKEISHFLMASDSIPVRKRPDSCKENPVFLQPVPQFLAANTGFLQGNSYFLTANAPIPYGKFAWTTWKTAGPMLIPIKKERRLTSL